MLACANGTCSLVPLQNSQDGNPRDTTVGNEKTKGNLNSEARGKNYWTTATNCDVLLKHYLTVDCNQNSICAAFEKLVSCMSCISWESCKLMTLSDGKLVSS